jgi:hypothetical protein
LELVTTTKRIATITAPTATNAHSSHMLSFLSFLHLLIFYFSRVVFGVLTSAAVAIAAHRKD